MSTNYEAAQDLVAYLGESGPASEFPAAVTVQLAQTLAALALVDAVRDGFASLGDAVQSLGAGVHVWEDDPDPGDESAPEPRVIERVEDLPTAFGSKVKDRHGRRWEFERHWEKWLCGSMRLTPEHLMRDYGPVALVHDGQVQG